MRIFHWLPTISSTPQSRRPYHIVRYFILLLFEKTALRFKESISERSKRLICSRWRHRSLARGASYIDEREEMSPFYRCRTSRQGAEGQGLLLKKFYRTFFFTLGGERGADKEQVVTLEANAAEHTQSELSHALAAYTT